MGLEVYRATVEPTEADEREKKPNSNGAWL